MTCGYLRGLGVRTGRWSWFFSLLIPSALLTACPHKTAVWTLQGSTADHLVFGVGEEVGKEKVLKSFPGLRVGVCDSTGAAGKDVWLIDANDNSSPSPTRVTYGEAPPGYHSKLAAEPLTPGCYQVEIQGTGFARFDVYADRRVKEELRGR